MARQYIEQYFGGIAGGHITACKKMVQLSRKIMTDLENKDSEWHFDDKMAEKHIGFIERFCRLPAGRLGAPFKMDLDQKAQIAVVFGFVDEQGLRQYQEVNEMEGRKNGKTTKAAALSIDGLCNDNEGAPKCYFAATKKEQADIGLEAARAMIETSPALKARIRKRVSDYYYAANMGSMKSLASNTNTLDGLDVHRAIIDELSAHKNRDVYDLIRQGMAARRQPLLWSISTNGFVRECIFDDQYNYSEQWLQGKIDNPRFIPFIYELDSIDELENEEVWIKANPGLDTRKSREFLRGNVQKAKDDPSFLATVLTKDFNLKANSASAWLSWEEISNEETFDMAEMGFVYAVAGIDAADSVDLNAARVLLMRKGDPRMYQLSMYWIPEDVLGKQTTDGNRRERDGVPYTEWVKRGLLRTCPGNKVDKRVFLEWFKEVQQQHGIYYHAIGYDPWHMTDDSIRVAFEQFLGKDNFEVVRQGPITMSDPMKEYKADLAAKRVVNNNNPIDNWCRANAAIRTDTNGNIQLDKKNGDRRNRIDGMVAELNAYIVLKRRWVSYSLIIK